MASYVICRLCEGLVRDCCVRALYELWYYPHRITVIAIELKYKHILIAITTMHVYRRIASIAVYPSTLFRDPYVV